MNHSEAFQILELSDSANPEEIKKQFKKLSKKLHPDVNKSPTAEADFKRMNEAYQTLQTPKEENPIFQGGFYPFDSFFSSFINQNKKEKSYDISPIHLNLTLSFKDSIVGLKQTLTYSRKIKCTSCNGQGDIVIDNCSTCHGQGRININRGNVIMSQPCTSCRGKTETKSCNNCNSNGVLPTETSISINIPGGVVSGNILKLNGMGNYAGSFIHMDQFSDALLHLTITPDSRFALKDNNVIHELEINLLQALTGATLEVPTILGIKKLTVPPLSKNKDELSLPNLGVNLSGSQKIILNISYPDDVSSIISLLQGSYV